jgi:hypothetical protein
MELGVNIIVHQELSHRDLFVSSKGVESWKFLLQQVLILHIFPK